MFQITETTEATLAAVTNRTEKHGDDDVPAVSLQISVEAANTLLDCIDPSIRQALYKAVDGQEQLPGIEPATPVLRCNSFADKIPLTQAHEGWTLEIDDSIDEATPMVFGGCRVDKLRVDAKQGGSIVLSMRIGTSDVDADRLGALAMHNGQSIWIRLRAPGPKAPAIDGSTEAFERDHPGASAEDLFAAEHGEDPGDELDDDGSGHADIEDDEDASPDLEDRLDNALRAADAEASGRASKAALDACEGSPFPRSETETPEREVAAGAEETKPRRGRKAAARVE